MSPVQSTLPGFAEPVARSRRHDPRTARQAAAKNPTGRASQADRLLLHLLQHGSVTADYAYRNLGFPDEGVTRGEWSTRIGVLIHRGQVERAGEVEELGRRGETRAVLSYRLTAQGREDAERIAAVRS